MNPTADLDHRFPKLNRTDLDIAQPVWTGRMDDRILKESALETIWNLHPEKRPQIRMVGKWIEIPRWQQAYGMDYHFSGQTSVALPVPPELQLILNWARSVIDPRLNGLLLNWYDGGRQDYIGAHKDSTKDLVDGTPIVTISLGAARTFRFSRKLPDGHHTERRDFRVVHGSVMVFTRETNAVWKHSVPHLKGDQGRRISVTIRAFLNAVDGKRKRITGAALFTKKALRGATIKSALQSFVRKRPPTEDCQLFLPSPVLAGSPNFQCVTTDDKQAANPDIFSERKTSHHGSSGVHCRDQH